MTLTHILIFLAVTLAYRLAFSRARLASGRVYALTAISALAVYWMQPSVPVRYMDYWLPTLTLALAGLGWALTAKPEERSRRETLWGLIILVGVALLAAALRYLPFDLLLTPNRPPHIWLAAGMAVLAGLIGWGLARTVTGRAAYAVLWAAIAGLVALLLALKTPSIALGISVGLRDLAGQGVERASALDIRWLGFSYLSFRLIHTFRDRQAGRLPAVSLPEYVSYAVFYPAFTAGPIDRLDRFIKDLRKPLTLAVDDFSFAAKRLALGLLKKFAIADSLALIALNAQNAWQVQGAGWAWLMVYAYAFQIFFDFSGYTDIAIAIGALAGVRLPENFNAPYLKPNLTQFWNNWHMTLTTWFRGYYFNPITRQLRRTKISTTATLLIMQSSTMILIGLWHGVSWNFVLWGMWHGLGMFVQNRYSEWVGTRLPDLDQRPRLRAVFTIAGILLTFHYVALGWVWFALPTPDAAVQVFSRLFGF